MNFVCHQDTSRKEELQESNKVVQLTSEQEAMVEQNFEIFLLSEMIKVCPGGVIKTTIQNKNIKCKGESLRFLFGARENAKVIILKLCFWHTDFLFKGARLACNYVYLMEEGYNISCFLSSDGLVFLHSL